MRDEYESELRIYQPSNSPPRARPMMVLIHGGGFFAGNNASLGDHARAIATLHDFTVVSLSYRLVPEHRFPVCPNDVWDSMTWLSQAPNAMALGCDLSLGFYLGGASAGANLAAVTAQRWVSDGCAPRLSGVWLNVPHVLERELVPPEYRDLYLAREQNANAPVFTEDMMKLILGGYRPDIRSPAFSPFQAENPHVGMPPVYIQVAGLDPLRDDGLIYEKALRAHGVSTRLDVYPGLPHGFETFFWKLKVSRRAMADTLMGIGWSAGRDVDGRSCEAVVEEVFASKASAAERS